MRSHYELDPAEYARQREGHLQRRRIQLVEAELAGAGPGELVVELGCGPGDVLAELAARRPEVGFLGLDIDSRMIEHARSVHHAANLEFRLHDVAATPLDAAARLVFGIDVVHHVHALDLLVAGVARVLSADGVWLVVEPNSRNPYIWLHQERMRRAGLDEAHFRRSEFERALAAGGLRVAKRSTAFLVPGAVQRVPGVVERVERALERAPVLGGSVVYRVVPE